MSDGDNLERLDAARGGEFWYRHDGITHLAPSPADLNFQAVLAALLEELVPGTPRMPFYKREELFRRWAAHYDLPPFSSAQRLAFLVDRHTDDLDHDLRVLARIDLGQLWRERRWRTLLAAIDRLPPHCYFAEAVGKDPEHAKALAEAMAAAPGSGESTGPKPPPQRIWTPEVELLTRIYDGLERLRWTTIAVAAGKKAPKPPEPSLTPTSLVQAEAKRAEFRRRKRSHDALARRMLPHKRD
jgi:hypothetical protein